jgi:mono/diheme cytochrome c family protein
MAVVLAFSAAAASAAETGENWTKNCASCHGKDGAGHTKAGRKLDVKDLTSATVQKGFTDDEAFTALKDGMKDKDGAEKMKPFADKLSDDEIKALLAYVRTLAK